MLPLERNCIIARIKNAIATSAKVPDKSAPAIDSPVLISARASPVQPPIAKNATKPLKVKRWKPSANAE